jgi:hypothetical protein
MKHCLSFGQGSITGVVLEGQKQEDDTYGLGLKINWTSRTQIDNIRFSLPFGLSDEIRIGDLPAGWSYDLDETDLILQGLSHDLPLIFFLQVLGRLPNEAEVEIKNQGERHCYDPLLLVDVIGGSDPVADEEPLLKRLSVVVTLNGRNMWINVGDFNTSIQTFRNNAAHYGDFTTDYSTFNWLSRARVGLDAQYAVSDNIRLSVGTGFRFGCPRTFEQSWQHTMYPQYNAMDKTIFRYSTIDLRAGLEARLPLSSPVVNKLGLTADGSVDFNCLKVNYQREFNSLDPDTIAVTQYTE